MCTSNRLYRIKRGAKPRVCKKFPVPKWAGAREWSPSKSRDWSGIGSFLERVSGMAYPCVIEAARYNTQGQNAEGIFGGIIDCYGRIRGATGFWGSACDYRIPVTFCSYDSTSVIA